MTEQEFEILVRRVRGLAVPATAAGFHSPAVVVASTVDAFLEEADDSDDGALRPLVEAVARQAVAACLAEQADWPAVTDCDRLDRAFAELSEVGIVSRQNFSCCDNCGCHEIRDEMDGQAARGGPVRGYAFYPRDETRTAAAGGGLRLSFGAVEDEEVDAAAIGYEIVGALRRHGLRAEWSGDRGRRIAVRLDWKRRLPAGDAGGD